ncbi:glutathione peroxidase [Furfurilactobacillus siliginis]|uniref:Glutathione peroxidase n=1 Tax=Furfurilactobacillus siliginis TaxID=348151 RepID=A0A0R2L4G0_9LACO|nr:glutathione peroxidase [Furfurilactobacillus siliginis]KRN94694.1 glutathione peroxidase [Furfurilactobacillus siliginis]GEK28406.1 glutathione peroxidase [Furfurilactobacillus siliginis]
MGIYDFSVQENNGQTINFNELQGKPFLIVNTASNCGLAPQFTGLEDLYQKYQDQGFTIIGFPSNDFKQELASNEAAADYCKVHYGVTFPMTKIVHVNGAETTPVFKYLKSQNGGLIKWNFTKFLIDQNGDLIKRFAPITTPDKIEKYIVDAL